MKVSNQQIAEAVFFKLYHRVGFDETTPEIETDAAALRLAHNLISKQSPNLSLSDRDCLIEREFEKFGCKFYTRNGNFAYLNFNNSTEIEEETWKSMCQEIYD